jgi:predicted tellurium resistance membrane protein TerC
MRTKPTAITELPPSPDDERRSRMVRYSIAMGIRLVCIALVVLLPDLWKIAPGIGALALPYFAVIIANNVKRTGGSAVARPGALVARAAEKDAA